MRNRTLRTLCGMLSGLVVGTVPAGAQESDVTYYRDALPVLQANCQVCHREGEIGPMSLGTYEEVRPWARAIRQAIVTREMPPWNADATIGDFHNDPSLSDEQIDTLVRWVDAGAPAGNAADAPPAPVFTEGWLMGTPDAVFEMPITYEIPANATIEYTYLIVPSGFEEDRWVTAAEFRPGNRAVVHHVQVFIRHPESTWLRGYPVGEFFVPAEQLDRNPRRPGATTNAGAGPLEQPIITYVPGGRETVMPDGYAWLVPAGSDLVFQLHYTTNGTETRDRSRFGFTFADERPSHRLMRVSATNDRFTIPPGATNHQVSGRAPLAVDAELLWVAPHMHLRGKSMALGAELPSGERTEILNVPSYDFNWQLNYELRDPLVLPAGTFLTAEARFDNSASNRYNPDPTAPVRWGDQSWEEMMVGFFYVAVDPEIDPRRVVGRPEGPDRGPNGPESR